MHIDVTLEDIRIIADMPEAKLRALEVYAYDMAANSWEVTFNDNPTGQQQSKMLNSEELAAILFLAVEGDEHPQSALLYPIAEKALEDINPVLRPIP